MSIAVPYITRQVYSPQATAGRGIRSTVGQRFYGGLSRQGMVPVEPAPVQKPLEAMYAPEPMPTVNPKLFSGDGPGEGPDMGGPTAVSTGLMSQGTADTIESGVASALGFSKGKEGGYHPTFSGLVSLPATLSNPLGAAIGKAAHKAGAFLVGKTVETAKGLISGGKGGYGTVGPNPGQGFGGWGPVGDLGGGWGAAPSSSLADIGFGGGGDGGGHGGGAVGMGDVGGPGADAGVVGF